MRKFIKPPNMTHFAIKAFFTTKNGDLKELSKGIGILENDIYLPIQKHTDKVIILEDDFNPEIADAVITKRKGILIGVQVADCVPILLFDSRKLIISSVHAGWRGTAAQIIKKTIKSMVDYFSSSPQDIKIALGPSIRWNCYCVDHKVKDAICRVTGNGNYHMEKYKGKYCIDLSSANVYQAMSMGVPKENIWSSNECTYCNPEKYYSYRYGKDCNGRQGGFIGIL